LSQVGCIGLGSNAPLKKRLQGRAVLGKQPFDEHLGPIGHDHCVVRADTPIMMYESRAATLATNFFRAANILVAGSGMPHS
jgi:hypothetical protein